MHHLNATLAAAVRNAATTREVAIERGVAAALPTLAQRCVPAVRWMLVADQSTWSAAGASALAHLQAEGAAVAAPLILPAQPRLKPRVEAAHHIADRLRQHDAVAIAAGSGVVSDLVKYASALAGKPYLCIASAASMDGYAASGAALLQDGFKRTLPCAPPLAVLADPDVLAAAPARMTGWGYGDLAGKVVAGADWLLADALGIEAIAREPFSLVQDHLTAWLAQPERLGAQDPDALGGLLAGLLVSGFAMQSHGNSRPASGSDHQFSHLWEMEGLTVAGEPAAHGACVGVGCVAMLALYEWLLAQPARSFEALGTLPPFALAAAESEVRSALGSGEIARAALPEMQAKRAIGSRADRVRRFTVAWPGLRQELARVLVSAATMQRQLRAVGAAAHPADLGLSLVTLAADYRRARLIRRRYTLLDLLEDLGCLDQAVAALFAPQGFWGRQAPVTQPVLEPIPS